jgi:hypothetical protein
MPATVSVDESTAYNGELDLAGAAALVPSLDRVGHPNEPDYAATSDDDQAEVAHLDERQASVAAAAGESAAGVPDERPVLPSQLNQVFSRVAELERSKQEAESELQSLRARAKLADEYEAVKRNPAKFLKDNGWTQDTLADYVLRGDHSELAGQAKTKSEIDLLREELAAERNARLQKDEADQVRSFKGSIPAQIQAARDKAPLTSDYYETPEELSEAVYSVMAAAARGGRSITILEAAGALEAELVKVEKRVTRARSKSSPAAQPPRAVAPAPKTLTNAAASSPARPAEPKTETYEPDFASAAATMRALKAQLAANQ